MSMGPAYDAESSLKEICEILIAKDLLEPEEELTSHMLEDLVHYAYFTGCVNRSDVGRLLNLGKDQTRKRVRSWKMWQDGNRSCQLRRNPFYEDWGMEGNIPMTSQREASPF